MKNPFHVDPTPMAGRFGLRIGLVGVLLILLAGCGERVDPAAHDDHDPAGHAHAGPAPQHSDGTEVQLTGDLCAVHKVPIEVCFLCDPGLRDPERLWCNEHERYEDRCWLCHPERQDPERAFCEEHGLYEDECFYCDPELAGAATARAVGTTHDHELFCAEHGVPEAECGICRPDAIAKLGPGDSLKVRLPSKDSVRGAGVQLGKASVGRISDRVECYAELAFDQNKLAQIVAPVSGIIDQVTVDLGSRVEEGQTVARLWSAEIAEAVAAAVLSHQTLDRERKLREQRVTSEQDLQQAEAAHRAACQQLRTFGFTEERIDALSRNPDESVLLAVTAPFAGEIIDRLAVRGELAETGSHLFTLGDRSVMWAMLNIPEAHLGRVETGQVVELNVDSIPGQTFTGRLTWISAEVDERSRLVRARAEVSNPDGLLRARMFATARVLTRSPAGAVLLPASAIQQVEGRPLVFVQLEPDLFEARPVRLGARADGRVEIKEGVRSNEWVAVNHVFPLKSQLLISRLGAGCAHE